MVWATCHSSQWWWMRSTTCPHDVTWIDSASLQECRWSSPAHRAIWARCSSSSIRRTVPIRARTAMSAQSVLNVSPKPRPRPIQCARSDPIPPRPFTALSGPRCCSGTSASSIYALLQLVLIITTRQSILWQSRWHQCSHGLGGSSRGTRH